MAEVEVKGWTRTVVLGLGALAGVLATAGLLHILKEWGIIK